MNIQKSLVLSVLQDCKNNNSNRCVKSVYNAYQLKTKVFKEFVGK